MRRTTPRRPLPGLVGLLVLSLVAAACGGGDEVTIRRSVDGPTLEDIEAGAGGGAPITAGDAGSTDAGDGTNGTGNETVTTEVVVVDPGSAGQPAQGGQPTATTAPAGPVDRNSDRGVTTDNIKIGVITPISGGTRFVGEPPYRMTLAYAEDVNRRGGINGRMVEVIGYDVCSTCPEDALAAAIKAVEQDKVFAVMNSYVVADAMGPAQEYLSEHETPQIQINNAPVPDRWSYSIGLSLPHRGAIDADAVHQYLEQEGLPKKVALLRFNTPFDEEVQKWQKAGLAKYPDIEIVASETVEFGSAAMAQQGSQTDRMKAAGAEMVVCSMGLVCGFNASNADQKNWPVPYFSTIMYDEFALDVAGDAVDNHDIIIDSDGLGVVTMDTPAFERYNRVRNTYYRDADIGVLTLYAALGFTIFEDGVTEMGDNVTRVGMRDFMSRMQGYTADGFVEEINVVPGQNHNGVTSALILKLDENRKWQQISPGWVDPDPRHGL